MKPTIYWIEGPWKGRLAILPRPRGGDWLEDEIRGYRASGIDGIISALTDEEMEELDLLQEERLSRANGLQYMSFGIPDRGVPESSKKTAALLQTVADKLAEGENFAVHCRQGVGRSAMLAACLLALAGIKPDKAFQTITAARGCPVPDTVEQREWVGKFARDSVAAVSKQ